MAAWNPVRQRKIKKKSSNDSSTSRFSCAPHLLWPEARNVKSRSSLEDIHLTHFNILLYAPLGLHFCDSCNNHFAIKILSSTVSVLNSMTIAVMPGLFPVSSSHLWKHLRWKRIITGYDRESYRQCGPNKHPINKCFVVVFSANNF